MKYPVTLPGGSFFAGRILHTARRQPKATKAQAIARLRAAGWPVAAARLAAWRSVENNNWGWDSWFKSTFPHLVHIVWEN